MSLTEPVRWDKLKPGDWIICPGVGPTRKFQVPEKVTWGRRYTGDRWTVRTSQHDHIQPRGAKVERFKDAESLTLWYTEHRKPNTGEQT